LKALLGYFDSILGGWSAAARSTAHPAIPGTSATPTARPSSAS